MFNFEKSFCIFAKRKAERINGSKKKTAFVFLFNFN